MATEMRLYTECSEAEGCVEEIVGAFGYEDTESVMSKFTEYLDDVWRMVVPERIKNQLDNTPPEYLKEAFPHIMSAWTNTKEVIIEMPHLWVKLEYYPPKEVRRVRVPKDTYTITYPAVIH